MKLTYLIAILFVSILVLGCSAKETTVQTAPVVDNHPAATTPAVQPSATITQTPVSQKILVADTENQRVIELDKNTKEITWQYGCDKIYSSGRCGSGLESDQLYQPASAVYDGADVLIADKANDRVIKVSKDKDIVWSYTELNDPTFAVSTSGGGVLITDSINNRVLEVDASGTTVWSYGCARMTNAQKCAPGTDNNELNVPNMAIELSNGNILIADKGNNRIIEVSQDKQIVFEHKSGLNFPSSAVKTDSGYLIANTNSNSVILVDSTSTVAKEFSALNHPIYAEANSNKFLITDSFSNRIIETDADGSVLWYYGDCGETDGQPDTNCQLGVDAGQLFKPSTAVLG